MTGYYLYSKLLRSGVSRHIGTGGFEGSASSGDAVDFGAAPGTLIVEAGASFSGAIGGFADGDIVDITNLSVAQVTADFTSSTDTLTTPADGTLVFAGSSTDEQFYFSADGQGGTDISLGQSQVNDSTVTVGSGSSSAPVIISANETVAPTAADASGVIVNAANSVTNSGDINGGSGGTGVVLAAVGATVTNLGTISGGANPGGTGGVGVYLDGGTLITAGTISGGTEAVTGAAIEFGSQASTLVVDPNAVFDGDVVANSSVNDVLQLGSGTDPTLVGLGTQITGFSTLVFDPGAQWTVAGTTMAFEALKSITGFTNNDAIVLTDLTFANTESVTFNDNTLAINLGRVTVDLNLTGSYSTDQFVLTADSGGGTLISLESACYLRGTQILTEFGERPIESLDIGDRVITHSGKVRPIHWIGRRRYSADYAAGNARVMPVCIRANALADGVPRRDLWVSPEHALFIDEALIPAIALINGTSIVRSEVESEIEYLHVELESHDVILANGAPSESFVDDHSRILFANAADYAARYPGRSPTPAVFCAPRIEDGDELERVRRRLASRCRPWVPRAILATASPAAQRW